MGIPLVTTVTMVLNHDNIHSTKWVEHMFRITDAHECKGMGCEHQEGDKRSNLAVAWKKECGDKSLGCNGGALKVVNMSTSNSIKESLQDSFVATVSNDQC